MIAEIQEKMKAKKNERLLKQHERSIASLTEMTAQLQSQIQQEQITIGQWQNKLFAKQLELDAYRTAQSRAMDIFKAHYEQEKRDFMEYNSTWRDIIRKMELNISQLTDRVIELEMKNNNAMSI
jgi:hypothetical protein